MSLHLVGETIDARRAHHQARTGEILQLVRGVYVGAEADADAVVLGHAPRIAHYLYPTAYLSSASAGLLGPTADGRLFISGRRNQRTRLRGLEIVQNQAPDHPSVVTVIVGDDMGELRLSASSLRQRVLEAFRLRSEHAGAVTEPLRLQWAERLIEEYGSPTAAADALWALARENGWYREGEAAERYLLARSSAITVAPNKAALDLAVAWHGTLLGHLAHDGFEWRWTPDKRPAPPLVRPTTPGKLPPFIDSLLPEGWLAQVLHQRDEREVLRQGRRYLSNITIADRPGVLASLPQDVLGASLDAFTENGGFTGRYAGPSRGELEGAFEQNLAEIFARAETPRLSGVQIKAPMFLQTNGDLVPAVDEPFTHILKPAGTAGFETLPVVEWLCLQLGRAAGFDTPANALVRMPDRMPPALVVERFDIRQGPDDQRRIAMEDFCSILDLPTTAKYDGTIERMARALRPLSTDPAADLGVLFRRALFAWLIADGDMHLKNVALLKTAPPRAARFSSVRFAPLYDAVTTQVFPGLEGDRMALKLNGKDSRLTPQDFVLLARTMDLPAAEAQAAAIDLAERVNRAAADIKLPGFAQNWKPAIRVERQVREIAHARCAPFLTAD